MEKLPLIFIRPNLERTLKERENEYQNKDNDLGYSP